MQISPSPSSFLSITLACACQISFPAAPTLGSKSGVTAEIGHVSVNPYPCKKIIPISSSHLPAFLSIGAAAETINLSLPPN